MNLGTAGITRWDESIIALKSFPVIPVQPSVVPAALVTPVPGVVATGQSMYKWQSKADSNQRDAGRRVAPNEADQQPDHDRPSHYGPEEHEFHSHEISFSQIAEVADFVSSAI